MIVHISGAPGSGKSTIGKYFKKNGIATIDMDRMYHGFIEKSEKDGISASSLKSNVTKLAQQYYDRTLGKIKSKNRGKYIIVFGLNYPDPRVTYKGKIITVHPFKINVRADHIFFIDIDPYEIAKRYFLRSLRYVVLNIDEEFENIVQGKKKKYVIDLGEIIESCTWWKKKYAKDGYIMLSDENVITKVSKLVGI